VRFSRKQQDGFTPNCFSGFSRKHLFITTSIEKAMHSAFKGYDQLPIMFVVLDIIIIYVIHTASCKLFNLNHQCFQLLMRDEAHSV